MIGRQLEESRYESRIWRANRSGAPMRTEKKKKSWKTTGAGITSLPKLDYAIARAALDAWFDAKRGQGLVLNEGRATDDDQIAIRVAGQDDYESRQSSSIPNTSRHLCCGHGTQVRGRLSE